MAMINAALRRALTTIAVIPKVKMDVSRGRSASESTAPTGLRHGGDVGGDVGEGPA